MKEIKKWTKNTLGFKGLSDLDTVKVLTGTYVFASIECVHWTELGNFLLALSVHELLAFTQFH